MSARISGEGERRDRFDELTRRMKGICGSWGAIKPALEPLKTAFEHFLVARGNVMERFFARMESALDQAKTQAEVFTVIDEGVQFIHDNDPSRE